MKYAGLLSQILVFQLDLRLMVVEYLLLATLPAGDIWGHVALYFKITS